jgi:dihydrofolate reductase
MKKLKLQMQLSVDGFVAGPEGQLDWMTWNWDMQLMDFVRQLTDSVDTILMGRKMSTGFIQHWEKAVNDPDDPSQPFAENMVNTPKVIFSRTQSTIEGINAAITNEPIADVVNMLKDQPGKDMIVYGGAEFVSSLIDHQLIDELYLFVNPTAIGQGLRIFNGRVPLTLDDSIRFECGIIVNKYLPVR